MIHLYSDIKNISIGIQFLEISLIEQTLHFFVRLLCVWPKYRHLLTVMSRMYYALSPNIMRYENIMKWNQSCRTMINVYSIAWNRPSSFLLAYIPSQFFVCRKTRTKWQLCVHIIFICISFAVVRHTSTHQWKILNKWEYLNGGGHWMSDTVVINVWKKRKAYRLPNGAQVENEWNNECMNWYRWLQKWN